MNNDLSMVSLVILIHAAFTDQENMEAQELFKLSEIKVNMAELLSQLANIYGRDLKPLASLKTISYCDLCGSKYQLLVNDLTGRENLRVLGAIFCPDCGLTEETPYYLFTTLFSTDGEKVPCDCRLCKECRETAVDNYQGSPICLKCILKHNLKSALLSLSPDISFE